MMKQCEPPIWKNAQYSSDGRMLPALRAGSSAQALSKVIKGSELTAPHIRSWLLSRRERNLPISRIVLDELSGLRSLRTAQSAKLTLHTASLTHI